MSFLALFVSLPTKASTGRMRVWRSVKAQGCATLRDGVYLLPDSADSAATLGEVAAQAVEVGGSGQVYRLSGCDEAQKAALRALFDRGEEYASIAEEIKALGRNLASPDGADAMRKLQPLVRRFEQVNRIDFFPGEAQRQTLSLLDDLRDAITRRMSPDEPTARQTDIPRLNRADYQGRTWATRARPWVDRLASAWLIRRFIDPSARIVWLASPSDCRNGWLGFDFDGAAFSHVGTKVTFETLLASFGLDSAPALVRLGKLVHCLDLGGLPVAEALGIESLLAGLRASEPDDDALLARACEIFDWLLKSYEDKTT
ncbi:TPA: chromate resistance protein ChrB domain-containing protein [Pseudomonas aeruginosa]|uniref:Chromate resistance exported protein n=8 Tax=Pseudomonadaceae TaxID=135621 RepID=G8CP42_PSEAI|nr:MULTISPECIES: chromate resistance protein ChrB domain-containing protein [Gammaproteobacteria]EQM69801.1 ChrB [Pseudomonas alcaligenes OT 69]KFB21535.1 ChrB [Pseudomonas aeruginosa PGPR2]MAY75740.1 chromate resistance protein [Phycisphaerae bacterium]MBA4724634.1 chromate resistance protein [Pseudomonas sp.]MBP6727193.1 chromate resistance protein [Thauera sp.]MDN4143564.1 chromate resistance protein [Pseudomonas tohonis]QLJ33477.1 chromate resistance protein [Serratia marcescens]CDI9433